MSFITASKGYLMEAFKKKLAAYREEIETYRQKAEIAESEKKQSDERADKVIN